MDKRVEVCKGCPLCLYVKIITSLFSCLIFFAAATATGYHLLLFFFLLKAMMTLAPKGAFRRHITKLGLTQFWFRSWVIGFRFRVWVLMLYLFSLLYSSSIEIQLWRQCKFWQAHFLVGNQLHPQFLASR